MAPLILHVFSTFATGGPQTRFAAIVNHWGSRFRHAVVAMDGNLECRARLDPGLDVQFPAVEVRKGDTLGNARRFRALLRSMRPHALLTNNWGSIEWAMANAVPVVRHVHTEDGFGPEEAGGQLPRRVLMRRMLLRRQQVVVPSRTLWTMATRVWRLDPRRVLHVPNGVDLRRFTVCDPGVPGVPVIGTVAALRAEKNLARLLRAFRIATDGEPGRLVPGRLTIVGDGPERPKLEALAAELGIADRVRFTGQTTQPAALYREFHVFALSSDTEQMPLSLLEAMATGLPVATTDVGDVRAMLPDANHPFVMPRDDAALGAALRALLLQPELRRTLGTANRARAEQRFDQRDMFAAWAGLMDGTAAPSAPPGACRPAAPPC